MKVLFNNIQSVLLNELDQAKESIRIAVAWFTNVTLMECLLSALSRGVKVTIVINNDEINNNATIRPYLSKMLEMGCIIHWINYPELMHQKFCVIDNRVVANGSYNWTYYAESHNRENVVFLDNPDAVTAFTNEFVQLTKLYPACSSIPAVGRSNIDSNIVKRLKDSESKSVQRHQKDIPEYSITTNWTNQSSINMVISSNHDFVTILRRKPKSIEKVFDAEFEDNEYSCYFNEQPQKNDEIEKERHLFKVFVESASGDVSFHIDDNDYENVNTTVSFEKDSKYAILLYSSYQTSGQENDHERFRYRKFRIPVVIKIKTEDDDSLGMSIENLLGVKEQIIKNANGTITYNSIPDGSCYYIVLRPTSDMDGCIIEAESCGRKNTWKINVKAGTVYYLGYICNLSNKYKAKRIFIEKGIKR